MKRMATTDSPGPFVEARRTVVIRRTVITLIVLACIFGVYLAGSRADTGEPDSFLPGSTVVTNVSPQRTAVQVPRQTPIAVDLDTPYKLDTMLITEPDKTQVQAPIDQMKVDSVQQIYTFIPGAGKTLDELPAGLNCVQVTVSRVDNSPSSVPPYSWCFTVV
jgi:hypothetical protein